MKLVRIASVKPLSGFKLKLGLTDGRSIERDVGPLLVGPAFAAIRSRRSTFAAVRVDGGALVWPNGADLCPDTVIWRGRPPWADASTTKTDDARLGRAAAGRKKLVVP